MKVLLAVFGTVFFALTLVFLDVSGALAAVTFSSMSLSGKAVVAGLLVLSVVFFVLSYKWPRK